MKPAMTLVGWTFKMLPKVVSWSLRIVGALMILGVPLGWFFDIAAAILLCYFEYLGIIPAIIGGFILAGIMLLVGVVGFAMMLVGELISWLFSPKKKQPRKPEEHEVPDDIEWIE